MAYNNLYQLQKVENNDKPLEEFNPDVFFAPHSKTRLRWNPELHDLFVKAVNELGGPSKATPKSIWNLMRVPGLTLYHLKSHLQKFRLGRPSRRFSGGETRPAKYSMVRDERLASEMARSSASSMFGRTGLPIQFKSETMGIESLGNRHLLLEQGNSETAMASSEQGTFATTRPALLSLFPSVPASRIDGVPMSFPEWLEMFEAGGGQRSVVLPQPTQNVSAYPELGYPAELGLVKGLELGQGGPRYGSFFDDVASFWNVDAYGLPNEDGVADVAAGNIPMVVPPYFPRM